MTLGRCIFMFPEPNNVAEHIEYLHQQVEKLIKVRGWMQSGWHDEKLNTYTDKKLHSVEAHLKDILDSFLPS